jgi:hypothetical protein
MAASRVAIVVDCIARRIARVVVPDDDSQLAGAVSTPDCVTVMVPMAEYQSATDLSIFTRGLWA